jgi:hypothetical protein
MVGAQRVERAIRPAQVPTTIRGALVAKMLLVRRLARFADAARLTSNAAPELAEPESGNRKRLIVWIAQCVPLVPDERGTEFKTYAR